MGQFEYFKRFLLKFEDLSIFINLTPRSHCHTPFPFILPLLKVTSS